MTRRLRMMLLAATLGLAGLFAPAAAEAHGGWYGPGYGHYGPPRGYYRPPPPAYWRPPPPVYYAPPPRAWYPPPPPVTYAPRPVYPAPGFRVWIR